MPSDSLKQADDGTGFGVEVSAFDGDGFVADVQGDADGGVEFYLVEPA